MEDNIKVKPSWTARVLIYQGSTSLEEIMFDSYEADSESSARAIAVELGYGYLKTLGISDKAAGCSIIMVVPDIPIGSPRPDVRDAIRRSYSNRDPHRQPRTVPIVIPFKCPIVKLCHLQYTGVSVGNSFNIEHMPLPETEEET
jgi:hypothetical protein